MNFLKAEWNGFRGKEVVSSYPYILKIEPSNICNMRCAYCYDNRRQPRAGERPYGRMSFEQFKQIVDEVGDYLFMTSTASALAASVTLDDQDAADLQHRAGLLRTRLQRSGLPQRIVDWELRC